MPDTILTDELINRLNPFVSYPEFDGHGEGRRGILRRPLIPGIWRGDPDDTATSHAHDLGIKKQWDWQDGNDAIVRRHVLQNPELGVRHRLAIHIPVDDRIDGRGGWSQIELANLTSDEAKRIIRVLRDNPEMQEAIKVVPFNRKPGVDHLGRSGHSYHFIEDPSDNLRNWLSELWDKQKNVPEDQIQFKLYPDLKDHHKKVKQELFDALNKRVHKSNALMTAGMGLAGAIAGDEDSKIKTSILGALGAGLGTYGSAYASRLAPSDKLATKLYRTMVRRPWLRMGAGALGGLAGILAGKGTSGSDEGVLDEVAEKVEDLTGSDVKGSDMLKYILLGGGGLAALGGLGYAATRKKKKKSKEKRDE